MGTMPQDYICIMMHDGYTKEEILKAVEDVFNGTWHDELA